MTGYGGQAAPASTQTKHPRPQALQPWHRQLSTGWGWGQEQGEKAAGPDQEKAEAASRARLQGPGLPGLDPKQSSLSAKTLRAGLASRSPWKPTVLVLARHLSLDHGDQNKSRLRS